MSKGLEALEEINELYLESMGLPKTEEQEVVTKVNIIEKELKALEIIKEKKVDVLALFCGKCPLKEYNDMHEDLGIISQEEYDLLKEVLL